MMGKTMLFKPSERLFNKSANLLRGQRLLYKRVDGGILEHPGVLLGGWVFSWYEEHSRGIVVRHFNGVAIGKLAVGGDREQDVHDLEWHGNKRELYRVAHGDIDGIPDTEFQQMLFESASPGVKHWGCARTRIHGEKCHDPLAQTDGLGLVGCGKFGRT